jgi:glycosyltransferase involved in cell wall biosynthesis
MVFYEAHSLGAPVVSTYGFGSEYVIKNGHNGFLVPQDNHVEVADAIRKIVSNPTLRENMSKNGREEARKHSWDDIGVHYLAAYDEIMSARVQ